MSPSRTRNHHCPRRPPHTDPDGPHYHIRLLPYLGSLRQPAAEGIGEAGSTGVHCEGGRVAAAALDARVVGIRGKKVNWLVDANICGYNDTIDQEILIDLTAEEISDDRVLGKFFFGSQAVPAIATKLGSGSTRQRSSTRPSEDARSCNVAFLKALVALQKNAKQLGANAVVNIASFYKDDTLSSATEFECHAGVSAHVMLKGEFVKIAEK